MKTKFLRVLSIPYLAGIFNFVSGNTFFRTAEKYSETLQTTFPRESQFDYDEGKGFLEHHLRKKLESINIITEDASFISVIADGEVSLSYYFDFAGDTGFAIFDEPSLYRIETQGDYPWIKDDNVYFSLSDGFLRYDTESGIFNVIDIKTGKNTKQIYLPTLNVNSSNGNDGQLSDAGLPSYISNEHPGWELEKTEILSRYVKSYQDTNSFYEQEVKNKATGDTQTLTEGNCALNATHSFLYNLPSLTPPNDSVIYGYTPNLKKGRNVTNRFNYFENKQDYFSTILDGKTFYDSESTITWKHRESSSITWTRSDDLYWNIRTESIKKGYDPRSGFDMNSNSEYIIETVTKKYYDHDIDVYKTTNNDSVVSNIQEAIPVVVAVSGSKTYGNHGMCIYGYKKYKYTETKTVFLTTTTTTTYHYVWLVDDGWYRKDGGDRSWFDPSKSKSVSFFCSKQKSLFWPKC